MLDEDVSAGPDIWAALAAEIDGRHWKPELAPWVEVRAFEARGGRNFATVGNRRDLVYFRLEAAEVDLLPLLDGTRSLAEIVVAHLEQSGALDAHAVVDLVSALHAGGFLTEAYVDVEAALTDALAAKGASSRLRAFARTLSVEWSGAEQLTRWCYTRGLRFLFRPVGIVLALLVGLGGIVAFADYAVAHGLDYETESLGSDFLLLLVLNLLLIFFHELGHASALVHYRRRVRGAGFRISFGSPAFFVDSSDALMLGRRARIAQSFGGTYFELIASGVAAIALWRWPESDLAPTLFSIVFLSYFVLLLNLTPMLELDGYYILCDVIEVPDLRPRAFAFMRRDMWVKLRHRERWTAGELGLFLFGTLGFVASVFFLASALWFWEWTFGDVLRSLWRSGPLGAAGFVVLLSLLVGPVVRAAVMLGRAALRRLRTLFQRLRFRAQRRWRVEAAVALGELPLFDNLSLDAFHEITERVTLVDVAPGIAVFRHGERADAFYIVREGLLEVIEEDDDGTERIVDTMRTGESFGELGLVTGARRSATIRARARSRLFAIDKGTFDRVLADHVSLPEFEPTLHEVAALRALPPFAHLSSSELLALLDHGEWQNVQPHVDVVTQGDAGDAFYAVATGQFEVFVDGRRAGTCETGGHFGELALLTDLPRAATVRSVTPARVFRLERHGFEQLLADAFLTRVDGASHRVDLQRE